MDYKDITALLKVSTATKEDISKLLKCDERTAREEVSKIAHKFPVIATSKTKGYKIATKKEDKELVQTTINELYSRIEELSKRISTLERFLSEN